MTGSLEELRNQYNIRIIWKPFPLKPEVPEAGIDLADVFDDEDIDIDLVIGTMRETADKSGVPLGNPRRVYNTRLAQELSLWAETKGDSDGFHHAAFKAYFVDNVNLAKPEILLALVESLRLPVDEARDILENRSFRQMVDRDWQGARDLGIQVIPTFLIGSEKLIGSGSYRRLTLLMEKANVPLR